MKIDNNWIHRLAIFTAFIALVAIVAGAIVTSLERPIAATPAAFINPAFESWHSIIGALVVILTLLPAAGSSSQLGWIAVVVGLADAGLGTKAITQAVPELSGVLHALLAQILFGLIVAIAVLTSASWSSGPEPIDDTWRPSLRSLAIAVPAVILLQTALGACYRYHALGVIWHILNAMIVLLLILIVAVFLIRQFPNHPTLKPAAVALAVITSIQVMLGFTTFMMLILFPETSLSVVITSVLHVTTGSLTFGAGLTLSLLIRYNIRSAAAGPEITPRSVTAS
jgi:heme A synthase